ncbi:MAG: DUF4097 domain-containing protein [Acidobacteriota bacterium]
MRKAIRPWPLVLAAALAALPASAHDARFYRRGRHLFHEIAGVIPAVAPRIRVESALGSVRVLGSSAPEVRYRIQLRASGVGDAEGQALLEKLLVSAGRKGEWIIFRGEAAQTRSLDGLAAEFVLEVPRDALEIEAITGAGDVVVRGLRGRATLLSRGGDIVAEDLGGPLRAETLSGNVRAARIRSAVSVASGGGGVRLDRTDGDVVVRTSGGHVVVGHVGGSVRAETGGGDVRVEEVAGDVHVASVGGNIVLGSVGGEVKASTGGGSIRVASARGGVECETAAGPIDLRGIRGPIHAITSLGSIRADLSGPGGAPGDSDLQTWQGDVVVLLPESLALTVRALVDSPLGPRITSDFPLSIRREIESAGRPIEVAEGEIGGGGSLLDIRTLGGNVLILKSGKVGE